jgi:glycosyltransferase involved in cell wall biosynthesis
MKISYAITCHDEVAELQDLMSKLYRYTTDVPYEYEFVILQDGRNAHLFQTIATLSGRDEKIRHFTHDLNNDFGTHKNILNSHCVGDYIFQIDADEYPSSVLVQCLAGVISANPDIDLFWVPRFNTIRGITAEHLLNWGWKTEFLEGTGDLPAVNFPDYQSRIYKNDSKLRWVNKVHEHIEGTEKYTKLPAEIIWSLYHHKTIERQERQNEMYSKIK